MRRIMRKPCGLKVRWYAAHLIDINKYLDLSLGATLPEKIGVTKLNRIFIISMPKIWSKQEYVQGFDCQYIT